jgi:hypothetical protein
MKTCAVMQPYLFPYIGYYQLVYSADVFIIYDDVTFIKQSYINRNSILVNGQAKRFSVPVQGASSFTLIQSLAYGRETKLLKTIQRAYSKAPYYRDVIDLISSVFTSENRSVARVNELSIRKVFEYLGLEKEIVFASELDYDRRAERADRLVTLTKMYGCDHYVNSPGGKELYHKEYFEKQGIKLSFIESKVTPYRQLVKEFIPCLSMIDILMNCSKEEIIEMLSNYELH